VQTRAEAVAHYKAKVEFVKKNIDSLQEALQTKQDNLNYLVNIMQVKMAQQPPA
jgi:prefoldin alpha subunit